MFFSVANVWGNLASVGAREALIGNVPIRGIGM
jgi:hypothetical protein